MKNATDAMKDSHVLDILASVSMLRLCAHWCANLCYFNAFNLVCTFISHLLWQFNALQYRRMDFEEFCAATLSVHQLEALDRWEQHARCAYELFEKEGNRAIVIEELASVCACYGSLQAFFSLFLLLLCFITRTFIFGLPF